MDPTQYINKTYTEMYRTVNGLSPSFIADIFQINANLDTDNVSAHKVTVYIL